MSILLNEQVYPRSNNEEQSKDAAFLIFQVLIALTALASVFFFS